MPDASTTTVPTTVTRPEDHHVPDRSAETTAAGIPWLQFHQHRRVIRDRWPNVFGLPIISGPFVGAAAREINVDSMLDVGATSRVWEAPAQHTWPGVEYRSLDIDRTQPHDYHDFAEVNRTFDLVVCLEVLEHVPPRTALEILTSCVDACRPGGHVLVSVPNVLTPGKQLEFTHETAYSCMDLGGLLSWVGLDVLEASRLWGRDRKHLFLHQYIFGLFHRALAVDYCQSIVMLAQKPLEPTHVGASGNASRSIQR